MPCPCRDCGNKKRKYKEAVWKDLWKYGFVENYACWIHHGQAARIREVVVRQHLEEYDGEAGVAEMMEDFHEAQFGEEGVEEDPEATAKAFYDMLESA